MIVTENVCRFPLVPLDDVMLGIVLSCSPIRVQHVDGFDRHIFDQFIVFHYQWRRYSARELTNLWNTNAHRF